MNAETLAKAIKIAELLSGDGAPTARNPSNMGSEYKIVVLDKGFVIHGRVTFDGSYIVVSDCHCIRYWGTPTTDKNSGLGFLAENGPTKATKLDKQPTTRVHELQVVQMIDCKGKWNAS